MKVLSFSCPKNDKIYLDQVLPSLLNKKKETTIRPAWKIVSNITDLKKPKFSIGDKIRLEWKSRNSPKDSWFCKDDGMKIDSFDALSANMVFPKILGYGKITDVSKITMQKGDELDRMYFSFLGKNITPDELAKKDGFKDIDSLVDWFLSKYDLHYMKNFFVYEWRWSNGN